jgi:hypothetical protein
VTVSFWALAYGAAISFTEASVDTELVTRAGGAFGLSLILVPMAFAAAAFVSRRDDAPLMVLAGMGLFLVVGLPVLVLRNPVGALITGYAAGAVVSLAREEGTGLRHRAVAAAIVGVVVHLGFLAVPAPTAWLAPALPFTAMGIADGFTASRRGQAGTDAPPNQA